MKVAGVRIMLKRDWTTKWLSLAGRVSGDYVNLQLRQKYWPGESVAECGVSRVNSGISGYWKRRIR